MCRLRLRRSTWAAALGRYPSSVAARNTRSRVCALAPGAWRNTNDTSAWDTPARAATSRIVGRLGLPDVSGTVGPAWSWLIELPPRRTAGRLPGHENLDAPLAQRARHGVRRRPV